MYNFIYSIHKIFLSIILTQTNMDLKNIKNINEYKRMIISYFNLA